jgi:formylglycine-generating enzyme required for sulfatase activity
MSNAARMASRLVLLALACSSGLLLSGAHAADSEQRAIRGGTFASVLPPAPGIKQVRVADFQLDRTPVTNRQFARFIAHSPQWRRDRVVRIFADNGYLAHWRTPSTPGAAIQDQPVVHVSWFAASAYCEARGARLPRWHEWEYVAAASETLADARQQETWRQQILSWYSRSAGGALPNVGQTRRNFHGIQDLHGVIWEWVEDVGAMLVSGDNRQQSEPDALRFCGPGALTMEQKENYAVLMRIAMLSSMRASYTSSTMGFRCASDTPDTTP